jgi:hypothetical protein
MRRPGAAPGADAGAQAVQRADAAVGDWGDHALPARPVVSRLCRRWRGRVCERLAPRRAYLTDAELCCLSA